MGLLVININGMILLDDNWYIYIFTTIVIGGISQLGSINGIDMSGMIIGILIKWDDIIIGE
jgi:hypothetical protein